MMYIFGTPDIGEDILDFMAESITAMGMAESVTKAAIGIIGHFIIIVP